MRKYYITLSALLAFMTFYAQETNNTDLDKNIINQALRYADIDVAVKSMYSIIAKEGANSTYKDSLAYLYFRDRRYSSCFMVCTDILAKDGNKMDILEMQAVSLESLGVLDKAAQVYAKLVVKSNNNFHAYKLANLYFAQKKYDEAYNAIKRAQELKDAGTIEVTFAVNKNYNQQVVLLAAISNLKGLIEFEQDKMDLAKASFQKAIEIQSDFVWAKENLEAVAQGKEMKME